MVLRRQFSQGPAVRPKASALAWNALTDAASSAAATWAERKAEKQVHPRMSEPGADRDHWDILFIGVPAYHMFNRKYMFKYVQIVDFPLSC